MHSALQHDAIMSTSHQESLLVEKEADLVASKAIAALKSSRQKIRQLKNSPGVPTWTGKSGSAGAPRKIIDNSSSPFADSLRKFGQDSSSQGPTSSSILSMLRERTILGGGDTEIKIDDDVLFTEGSQESLIIKIQEFLETRGGKAKSSEIVGNFQLSIGKEQVLLFRKMLRGIAVFKKETGEWCLKSDFN